MGALRAQACPEPVEGRLRYFLQTDTALQGAVLRIFLRGVERCLREHSPGCCASARIGAIAFIHRFGSSLNEHIHLHCRIIDGVFEPAVNEAAGAVFHAASGLDAAALADVQAMVRRRILSAFVRRGLIGKCDAEEMGSWEHGGGFSLDASVCIGGTDRAGLERLLRYCARPPFALEHLQQPDAEHLMEQLAIWLTQQKTLGKSLVMIYHSPKPRLDGSSDLVLTPLELIDKIAALVPPPRAHRHRYYGKNRTLLLTFASSPACGITSDLAAVVCSLVEWLVVSSRGLRWGHLAPNASLRAAVTAMAPVPVIAPAASTNTEVLLAYESGFLSIESGEATAVMNAVGEWHGRAMFSPEILRALVMVPPFNDPIKISYDGGHLFVGTTKIICQWNTVSQAFIHDIVSPSIIRVNLFFK